ncbi:TPA: major capsid protein [Bacillus cereus]
MANQPITRIGDVIQPAVFQAYVQQKTMERSALVQSGIVQNSPEFDALASGPNTLVDMPYWEDLKGDSEVMSDTGALTPKKIGTNADKAKKQGRANAWGANGLSALLSGDDPMGAIASRVADYWIREDQKILLSMLKGVFASTSMAGHVHDISAAPTTTNPEAQLLVGGSVVDASQKLGDAKDQLAAVIMHSAVEAYLVKRQLIEYVTTVNEINQQIKIPYFMGKRVIVDDAMPFDPTTLVAEMYLFGPGAIALGNGSHPDIQSVETARDSLSSSGEDYLINRKIFILHARGIKWTESAIAGTFPTNAELANGSNYQLVYEPKAIRVVKHKFKIKL